MIAIHSILAGLPLMAAFGGSLVSAACVGAGCLGKNPETEGCFYDPESFPAKWKDQGSAHISIWYSPKCRAWWAEIDVADTCRPGNNVYLAIWQFWGRQIKSQRIVNPHRLTCPGYTWTYMLADYDSADYYNACWTYGTASSPETPRENDASGCTGRTPNPP